MLIKVNTLKQIKAGKVTLAFRRWAKPNVRKLKNLGLTISHDFGHELSARKSRSQATPMSAINLTEKFSLITEHWRPKVVAELNGQELKLAKFEGVFPWHHHDDADELFLVWKGTMRVEFRDRVVELSPGEMCLVPKGVEHRTADKEEAEILVFEPAETRNTGNIEDETYTAPTGDRI